MQVGWTADRMFADQSGNCSTAGKGNPAQGQKQKAADCPSVADGKSEEDFQAHCGRAERGGYPVQA